MRKVSSKLVKNTLEQAGLEPEDKGTYYKFTCPTCGHREAYNYKESPLLICSRRDKCGFSEDVFNYIKEEGLFKKDIVSEIGQDNYREEVIKVGGDLELPEGLTFFRENDSGLMAKKAIKYLKGRGLAEDTIYKMGYIYNPGGKFGFSIFIPFYEDGELVYFIARTLEGNALRYNNPKGVDGRNFVYNYDEIDYRGDVFIFEGVFDAISLEHQTGTAMLTSSLSKEQASKILERAPKNIIFVPDNDEAGKSSLYKNINTIMFYRPPSLDIDIYIYRLPEGKDFNDYSIETGVRSIKIEDCEKYTGKEKGFSIKRKSIV